MDQVNLTDLVSRLTAWRNCKASNNEVWEDKHYEEMTKMLTNLPHGSGLDAGVKFDFTKSTETRLIFETSWHHMNEGGFYDGWTDHTIIATPAFGGFNLRITGRDRNQIKDYLYHLFYETFTV